MSFRVPGLGENREGGAPGLMIYGLHNDLDSSDSEDSDYNPTSKIVANESEGSTSEEDSDSDSDSDDCPGLVSFLSHQAENVDLIF